MQLPTPTSTFYFANYDFSFNVNEDASSCIAHGNNGEIRGRINDFGVTFTCQHIQGLGITCYINSSFVNNINYINLLNSFGDVNTTPTVVLIDMGEVTDLDTNADIDNNACPYFANIPLLIRDNLLCTNVQNDFSEGFATASYYLYYADIPGDGFYWTVLWQQGVPPNDIFQNTRCNAYYTYYTKNNNNGLLAGVSGTWIYGNTRDTCISQTHFSHFVPIMYITTCARMMSEVQYANTKEDYEVLQGLFIGNYAYEEHHDSHIIKNAKVIDLL
jgi:hypothetical protein